MTKRKSNNKRNIVLVLLLVILLLIIYFLFFNDNSENIRTVTIEKQTGKRFEGYDDFYEATEGKWKLETIVYLLKEKKFVSSDNELQKYLVYKAAPKDTVQMTKSQGRWKYLQVVKNNSVLAEGWADVDKCYAEKIK
jgi:hypothetical protein